MLKILLIRYRERKIYDNIRGKKSEEKQITLVGFFFGGKTPGYQFWTGAVASIHVLCRWCLPFPVRVSANPGQRCLLVIAYAHTIFINGLKIYY